MLHILLLLPLIQVGCALAPTPRQIATTTSIMPTWYTHETPLPESTLAATKTLVPRCDNGQCEYGPGSAETLQASVVTSTILSTTSVPCYITTYVTESTTTTETIYSTETITSTVTEEGTVYIIKYSPTPVVKSTVYESVIQITQTQTSMWVETEGAYSEETVTGDTKTVNGGTGGGYSQGAGDKGGWKDAGSGGGGGGYTASASATSTGVWSAAAGAGYSSPASSIPAAAPAAQVNAWTHASGNAAAAVTPVADINAAAGGGSGWSTAGSGVTIAGQNMANWHNGAWQSAAIGWPMIVLTVVSVALLAIIL